MSLTKKQYRSLLAVHYDIERALEFLRRADVVGIAHTTTQDRANGGNYKIINPECVEVNGSSEFIRLSNPEIGSDIAGLHMGLNKLRAFLETEVKCGG